MLDEEGVAYQKRDVIKDPLSEDEIHVLLDALSLPAGELLRKRDPACKELGLTGEEDSDLLVRHMAANPGLLARPIGVREGKAVIGRPPELLLDL